MPDTRRRTADLELLSAALSRALNAFPATVTPLTLDQLSASIAEHLIAEHEGKLLPPPAKAALTSIPRAELEARLKAAVLAARDGPGWPLQSVAYGLLRAVDVAAPGRYTHPDAVWAALKTEAVKLPRMTWLIELADAGGVLPRRQDIDESAFVGAEELRRLYGEGNEDGALPIVTISFCWDEAGHPDPRGKQLQTVASALRRLRAQFADLGFTEMGVFWDWTSLYQRDPALWQPFMMGRADGTLSEAECAAHTAYLASRTPAQAEAFGYALHNTMDLWYAHQGTTVLMLTALPEGSARRRGYEDSGWTFYERCSAEQIKRFYMSRAKWRLVQDLGRPEAEQQLRRWPVGPDDFDSMVESKTFTNGADCEVVKALYRRMSEGQLGDVEHLDFDGMRPPSTDDVTRFVGWLSLCRRLKRLDLRGCTSLVALPDGIGQCTALETLYLNDSTSLAALPDGIGGCVALERLDLSNCTSLAALPDGIGKCVALTTLILTDCTSLAVLPDGIGGCVALKELNLNNSTRLAALPNGIGGCVALKELNLNGCTSLAALPDGIGGCVALKRLDLNDCTSLAALPDGIGGCVALTTLILTDCTSLAALPDGIGGCVALTTLILTDCTSLAALPDGIGGCVVLKELDLNGCTRLAALPDGISGCVALETLNLIK